MKHLFNSDFITFLQTLVSNHFFIIILCVLLMAFAIQMFYYLRYYTGICRRNRAVRNGKIAFAEPLPPASVVVCARNEDENLQRFLPLVLEQDYPDFEVIAVNDGSVDGTADVLRQLQTKYSHLYVTTIEDAPDRMQRVKSPKKLAMTVGIKAAHHETLAFIDADCRPSSNQWLRLLMRNFTPETEFVLGYGGYYAEHGFVSRLISFDTLFIGMQSLGMAYAGHPYMGVGRNMAYRRSTFFRLKGFAGHLHIPSGDDDLIVNEAGTATNTRIESCKGAQTLSVPKCTFAEWYNQKRRHLTASALYTSQSKFMLACEPLSRGLFYLALLAAIITFNPAVIVATAAIVLLRYAVQLIVVNIAAQQLGERKFFLSLPFFDILLPMVSLHLMTLGQWFTRKRDYEHHW